MPRWEAEMWVSVTYVAVKIRDRFTSPVSEACDRTPEMIQHCIDLYFINTRIGYIVILNGSNNAQTLYGEYCVVEYLLFQVSSQLVRGAIGDGEHHRMPVPVSIAGLVGLGSHGSC